MPLAQPVPPPENDGEPLLIVRFDEIHDAGATQATGRASSVTSLIAESEDRGLTRANAVLALETLRGGDVVVEGVDVVRALDDRPQYVLQAWRCETGVGEAHEAWARRSVLMAEQFVTEWSDPGDGTVRYVLLTDATESPRAVA